MHTLANGLCWGLSGPERTDNSSIPNAIMTSPGYSSHFGIENIPFAIASSAKHPQPTCVSRFEDKVIFLTELDDELAGLPGLPKHVFQQSILNTFAALPSSVHKAVRQTLQDFIRHDLIQSNGDGPASSSLQGAIENIEDVTMYVPFQIGDFTDFSCSHHHVQNASEAMTGVRSAPPAFFDMPIGYAGRCSSIDVSGTPVIRPLGLTCSGKPGASPVSFGPCRKMDYELELGAVIGRPVPRGERVLASEAEDHIFGYVLVNDWSGE